MKRIFSKLFIVMSVIAMIACQKLSDNTVAKVGKFEISVDDYKEQLSRRFTKKDSYADVDSSMKRDILNRMIEEKLLLNEAYDRDLDDDESINEELIKGKEAVLGNKYYERNVVDVLLTEEKLKDAFEKNKYQVRASHILIAYKGAMRSKAKRSKKEAKRLADQIYRQAKAGKSISFLASKYSDDPSAKSNKGDLGYFSWGQMAPPFQEKAFAQENGQISEPVLTSFGYHIIKTVDKRENPKFSASNFEKEKNSLKHKLYRGVQVEAKKIWDSLVVDLKEKYKYSVNEDNVKKVCSLFEEKIKNKKLKIKEFSNSEKSIVLASWNGGDCDLGYILGYYGARLAQYGNSLTKVKKMTESVNNFSANKMVINLAIEEGYENDPEVQKEIDGLKKRVEMKMVRKVEQEMSKSNIDVSEDDMKKYYEEHKDNFKKQAEVEVWEVFVTDEILAKKIAKDAKNGKDFEKLVAKYSEDKVYKKKKGYLGFLKSFSRGAVSKEAIKAGSNAIVGPIKYRKGWSIIKTGLEKPEIIKSFEESKRLVSSKLKNEKIRTRKVEMKKELWDSYSVKINEKIIGKI